MTEKPETNGQKMSRLIREAPQRTARAAMRTAIERNWTKTPAKDATDE
ncbi:hypothetical protein ACIQRE_27535 [Streptomyces griseoluteus]